MVGTLVAFFSSFSLITEVILGHMYAYNDYVKLVSRGHADRFFSDIALID